MQLCSLDTERDQKSNGTHNRHENPGPSQRAHEAMADYTLLELGEVSDGGALRYRFTPSEIKSNIVRDATVDNLPVVWRHEELEYHLTDN